MAFGFKATRAKGAQNSSAGFNTYRIKDGGTNTFYKGAPVKLVDGYIVPATTGDEILGIFVGGGYIDKNTKQPVFSPRIASGTETDGMLEGYDTPFGRVVDAPDMTFIVEADSGLTIAETDIGKGYTFAVNTGDDATGLSGATLDAIPVAIADADVTVLGRYSVEDNALGAGGAVVEVAFRNHLLNN